jgi:Ca-activated chloride channel family protein
MNLQWPGYLLFLALIPVIIGLYVWALRRRKRYTVRYSSLTLVRPALDKRSSLRRHVPFGLYALALASLIIAMARPSTSMVVPISQATIILTIDVSRSMCSTDIRPNRMEAAKDAALTFIRNQVKGTQIGIVAFAGYAEIVQPPTSDQAALEAAVQGLDTARRTAIGSGVMKAIDAISEVDERIPASVLIPDTGAAPPPRLEGDYAPHLIVLLTDGASNSGPDPMVAAFQAAERGIRTFTIGFGTERGMDGALPSCGQRFQPEQGFNNNLPQFESGIFGGGGSGFRRGIDEETLVAIADMTGGEYYSATSHGELDEVFRSLPVHLITREELMEVSVFFAAAGALLAALAIGLSMLWRPLN